jgi:hypothetical protein
MLSKSETCRIVLSFIITLAVLYQASCEQFRIQSIPGKGSGAVAIRNINVGELLIDEEPLFTINPSWFRPSESYSLTRVEKIMETVTEQQKKAFYSLHGFVQENRGSNQGDPRLPQEGLGREATSLDIFRTNAYPTTPGRPGLFLQISRLNR